MNSRTLDLHRALRASVVAVAALAASACGGGESLSPTSGTTGGAQTASLSLVASGAPVSGKAVALALDVTSPRNDAAVGVQGYLRYDASKLAFRGQADADANYVILNDTKAESGEIRFLAINPRGIGARAATLVFEAKSADAITGVRFEPELVTLTSAETIQVAAVSASAGDFAVPAAHIFTEEDDRESVLRVIPNRTSDVLKRPGDAAIYGDVTQDGIINGIDAQQLGRVAVGLNSPAQSNRDFAFAGNVLPNNVAFPGCRPGSVCVNGVETGPGQIDGTDVGQLAIFAVGTPRPVFGTPIRTPATNRVIVSGNITTNTTWTTGNVYELTGLINVTNGAALTIQPGVVIEGRRGLPGVSTETTALFVDRNGQIFVNGTAQAPVVFTCTQFSRVPGTPAGTFETTPSPRFKGCWGGVYIGGNAPINSRSAALGASPAIAGRAVGGCNQLGGEGNAPLYGGCNPTDNSGVVRYARFEYGGFLLSPNNELNNITLAGVGSGTVFEYVQAHGGLDDGLEIFGGTVNVSNIYLTANSDDSFDGSTGWLGYAHSVVIQMDPADGDKALEMDNTGTSIIPPASNPQGGLFTDGEGAPITRPYLTNFTLVGARGDAVIGGNTVNDAMHLRLGYQGVHRNFLVVAFPTVADIDNTETITSGGTLASNCSLGGDFAGLPGLVVESSVFELNAALGNTDAGDPSVCSGQGAIPTYGASDLEAVYLASESSNTSTTASGLNVALVGGLEAANNIFDKISPDFRPAGSGAAATGAIAVPAGVAIPASVASALGTYRGAVPPVGAIAGAVTWYDGWTRGWQNAAQP